MKTKTKSKKKKLVKTKNIKPSLTNQELKPIDEHGYPIPRSKICFRCEEKFWLTFVPLRKSYALRNFWYYWTEQESDKNKGCFLVIASATLFSFTITRSS